MENYIIHNANIWTEDKNQPWADCVCVEGKYIKAVGSWHDIEAYANNADKKYEIIDAEGNTILPGLIDGHTHISMMAKASWVIYGPRCEDKDKLLETIAEYAKKYPKEERPYFVYFGFCTKTFGTKGPNKEDLDKIISDRPARINDDTGHGCWYNSVALEMLKDENGVPHSYSPIKGMKFVQDENGEYTGYAFQTHQVGDLGVYEHINWRPPSCMTDEVAEPFHDILRHYGVIGYMDGWTESEEEIKYLYDLDKQGRLNLYYEATSIMDSPKNVEVAIERALDWQKKYQTDHIKSRIVKFFADGSIEFGDVLTIEPFSNDPTGKNHGSCNTTMEEMRDAMVRLNEAKLDLHVHCTCDGTFRLMCDACEAAQKMCGDSWTMKVTLAHCEIINDADRHRIKELGMYIDSTPHWNGAGINSLATLGEKRWEQMYDYASIIEDDEDRVGFSSDNMEPSGAVRLNPYMGMQIGSTRIDPLMPLDANKYPGSLRPKEQARLSLEQLIHGYTVANAKRMRLDDKLGSIEAGKIANFVVLEENIFEVDPSNIKDVYVVCTYFDGKEMRVELPVKEIPALVDSAYTSWLVRFFY